MEDTIISLWRKSIIQKIIQVRIERGLSQAQLANLVGINRSNISRLESGEHNPSLDFLLRVTAALEITLNIESAVKEQTSVYELRLYDKHLITFSLEEKGLTGLVAEILFTDDYQRNLFPLDLEVSGNGMIRWIQQRVIPKNRTFVNEILQSLHLSVSNTKGIIDVCKGLSLNDSYWIVPKGFDSSFSKYNLYENRFSEMLSLVAYTGIGQGNEIFSTSPELTTNGMLPKAWRFVDNKGIYLYKGGSSGAINTGNEPYSEYYACQIAKAMGLNVVTYDLENWKGILASTCRLFSDIDTAFIPISRLIRSGGLQTVLDYYTELGKDFEEDIKSMLVFDAVIYNSDRHFGNFGILRDNYSGNIIAPAPLYDHGLSLFNFATKEDISNLDEYAMTRFPAYPNITFENICKEVMGRTQAQQLRRLIGFTFTRHASINWQEERIVAIEKHLQKRVRQLLGLK